MSIESVPAAVRRHAIASSHEGWLEQLPELGRPCSKEAVAYAVDCAERRIAAPDAARSVLVHGDIHE